jgi:hypothetical protein
MHDAHHNLHEGMNFDVIMALHYQFNNYENYTTCTSDLLFLCWITGALFVIGSFSPGQISFAGFFNKSASNTSCKIIKTIIEHPLAYLCTSNNYTKILALVTILYNLLTTI